MFPFIPVAIAALAGAAYLKQASKKLSPDQQRLYDAALINLRDPAKLRQLAQAFEKEGFREQADMLYKRAHLKDLPKEIIKARNEIFHKALASKNIPVIKDVAAAFEQEGATNAAARLREHIADLESEPKPQEVEITVVDPPPSEPVTNPDIKPIPEKPAEPEPVKKVEANGQPSDSR